jgi:AraC family transcriptional regulator
LAEARRRVLCREHFVEHIPLATLAGLARLSTFHFRRALNTMQRIERAKILLAKPSPSVTDIASDLGFSQTSAFRAAFRMATGQTPTAYYKGS